MFLCRTVSIVMLLFVLSTGFCSSSFMVIFKLSKRTIMALIHQQNSTCTDSQNSVTFAGLSICILDTGDSFGHNCCALLLKDNIIFVKLPLSIKSLIFQETTHSTFYYERADLIEWRLLSQEWQVSLGLLPKKLRQRQF